MELLNFIAFLLRKFEADNMWLVKKVKTFGEETKELKEKLENCSKELNK